jgi:hypothetical protein
VSTRARQWRGSATLIALYGGLHAIVSAIRDEKRREECVILQLDG